LGGGGDAPPRIVADPSALQQLLSSSEDIATTTSEVLLRINRLLDEDNAARVAQTLQNLETLTGAAAAGGDDLRTVLAESAEASRRLAKLLDGADGVMRRLDDGLSRADAALSRELPGLLARLEASLDALQRVSSASAALVADNRAALDDFSQQGLAQVGPALQDLRKLLVEWQRISQRLAESPPDFVRGREALPEYQP
jgi:phospholipid/cholesterol/gamma-HCH transport system substrate-binding protein